MEKQEVLPPEIYVRIVHAGATGNVRFDVYKRMEISDCPDVQHIVPYSSFFMKKEGTSNLERDLHEVPISALIRKINEMIVEKERKQSC